MHVKWLHAKFHLQLKLSIENMRIVLSAAILTIQQPMGHSEHAEDDAVHKIP